MKTATPKKTARKKAARRKGASLKSGVVKRKASRKKTSARKAPGIGRKMLRAVPSRPAAETPKVDFGGDHHTSQIYSMGFEFAFAAWQKAQSLYKQACTFVYCKDFLHDAVWAHVNQTNWSIYGFGYSSGKDVPLDMDNCVFLFRNTDYKGQDAKLHDTLPACQQFLNGIEKKLGFEPSQLYKIPHDAAPCWLVVGDKGWQHAPPMVGLYTLLIRVGVFHKPGDSADDTLKRALEDGIKIGGDSDYAGNLDAGYIKSAKKGLDAILKHGLDVFHPEMKDNYPISLKKFGLHDNFGPVNFTRAATDNGNAKKAMPFWYRKEIWG